MNFTLTTATAVYAIMLAVFAAGMWAILAFGSTLAAQPDLAGEWEFSRDAASGAKSQRVVVDQSGRFIRMKFAGVEPRDFDLRIMHSQPAGEAPQRIELRGENGPVTFDATPEPNGFVVRLPDATYSARLVARTHVRPTAATRPTSAPTAAAAEPPRPSHAP
jgi:hypothetical protein